jgi:protein gp37
MPAATEDPHETRQEANGEGRARTGVSQDEGLLGQKAKAGGRMSDKTHIGWTEATWNPVLGCSKISAGCRGCYAINHVHRMAVNPNPKLRAANEGLTVIEGGHPNWTGKVRLIPERLDIPLRKRKPTMYFVNSLSDLFHEDLPDEDIYEVFAAIGATFRMWCDEGGNHRAVTHTYQVLTKRSHRMQKIVTQIVESSGDWKSPVVNAAVTQSRKRGDALPGNAAIPVQQWIADGMPGLWLGVSVENQAMANERIPHLLRTPAAVRFLSVEPMLGPVNLSPWLQRGEVEIVSDGRLYPMQQVRRVLHWVIVGGESGPGARQCDVSWIRSIVRQCADAGVPCFVKQLGGKPEEVITAPIDGNKWNRAVVLSDRKGGNMQEWPADLRVRQMPEFR